MVNWAVVAWLARAGLREVERRDGGPDYVLRQAVREVELAARAARYEVPSVVASVTVLADRRGTRNSLSRCGECGRPPADRIRRGLCDACYRRRRRRERLAG